MSTAETLDAIAELLRSHNAQDYGNRAELLFGLAALVDTIAELVQDSGRATWEEDL